jgi:hypothetical protein
MIEQSKSVLARLLEEGGKVHGRPATEAAERLQKVIELLEVHEQQRMQSFSSR